jgi:hypothetical protein
MPPPGDWSFLAWIVSSPLGLAAAAYWARSLRKRQPELLLGDPGNPILTAKARHARCRRAFTRDDGCA